MKRFLMALMLCLVSVIGVYADNPVYGYTTNCSVWNAYYQQWQQLDNGAGIKVVLYENQIDVASSSYQRFALYNMSNEHYNPSGHRQYTCNAIDQDGQRCSIRIVFRNDYGCEAPLQIYINYSNISYVYNIVPIQAGTSGI